jgi:hypothetical protein
VAEHSVDSPDQQALYELMRERLFELFGPGGSFRITLGRATTDDAVFVSTVADTVSWEVASALVAPRTDRARRVADTAGLSAEHEALWKHVETELLIRRTGPDALEVDAPLRSPSVAQTLAARKSASRAA